MLLRIVLGVGLLWSGSPGELTFDRYRGDVLAGDVSWMLEITEQASFPQADWIRRFNGRFITGTEGLDLDMIEDPLIRGVAGLYQEYWRDAIWGPDRRAKAEALLLERLTQLLASWAIESDEENVIDRIPLIGEKRGWYALTGRTPPLLELMLWKHQEEVRYTVDLPNGQQEVIVRFLDEFASRGWVDFVTFGHSSSAGWSTSDVLYCMRDRYDRESEAFQVSYLKHEGQHFADQGRFPELSPTDLEYRAKLVELIYAETTLYELLDKFLANARPASSAPHPRANWMVVERLSAALELQTTRGPVESQGWRKIPATEIRTAARNLFLEDGMLRGPDDGE